MGWLGSYTISPPSFLKEVSNIGSGTNNTAVLDGFTISNGRADGGGNDYLGGGMYIDTGNPAVRNVVFKNNYAGYGGGLYIKGGLATSFWGLTFDNNTASFGGGVYNKQTDNDFSNITFANNTASSGGGAIMNFDSAPTFSHLTFSGNTSVNGGGMNNQNADPVITNTIFWGNNATSSGDQIYNSGSSSTISDSVVEGGFSGGTNIITDDPLLGALGDNGGRMQTISIAHDSPAIDAGGSTNCANVDQRGITRSSSLSESKQRWRKR